MTDQALRQKPAPVAHTIGFIGQSNAMRQVTGYGEVGGTKFWTGMQYKGDTVSDWAVDPANWSAFEAGHTKFGAPTQLWLSMGQHHGDHGGIDYGVDQLYDFMVTILHKVRAYSWMAGVPLFWSAVNGYTFPNAIQWQDCKIAVDELVGNREALGETAMSFAGPLLTALNRNQTADTIHPNGPTGPIPNGETSVGVPCGRFVGGQNLKDFFG